MTVDLNRRALLTGIAATGFAAAMADPLSAARKPFFARFGLPIGLQLYTLGDEPAKDLDES